MLKRLTIDQFVIIDHLDLDLEGGLTILTGETGAGKSILLDATGLVLGEPSEPSTIRQGADKAEITALFAPNAGHPVWAFLQEHSLVQSGDKDFKVARTLHHAGPDDVIINDRTIDVGLLKQIGTYLVEIHGQFANQSLLEPSNQMNLLDLSGNFDPEIFKNVADALREVKRTAKELEEEKLFLVNHKREFPKIEEVVGKFDKLGMEHAGYVDEVVAEYARLLTAKETSEAFQDILAQLIAANGIVMGLSAANHILDRNQNLEAEKMEKLKGYLKVALDNSRSAVAEMRRIAPDYDIDTAPIYRYEKILQGLKDIAHDNKLEFGDLSSFWETMSSKLSRLRAGKENIAAMEDRLIQAKNTYRHHAHILHEKRVEAGLALSAAITAELAPLKLPKAEFSVQVEEQPNMTWTAKGLDKVTFTARMNPGQAFSPVAETASGGELARLILALKVIVQDVQTIPTLIFDEVDTGIGGAAAAAVGERLALLADTTQVLVITHSPQVASRGDLHLHVSKKTDGVSTSSVVSSLTLDERIDEISRMLAGDTITPESKAAAQSLINEAKQAGALRKGKKNLVEA